MTDKYIHIRTLIYPIFMDEIEREFPGFTFPENPTDAQLKSFDYAIVSSIDKPVYDRHTHYIEEGSPVETDGEYNQVWGVLPLSSEEIDLNLAASKEIKYLDIWIEYQHKVESTSADGVKGSDPNPQKRLNDKSNKRLTKKSKGETLTAKEQIDENWYDAYNNWIDENHDVGDSACDDVELLTTTSQVNSYDEVNMPLWTTFIPPV